MWFSESEDAQITVALTGLSETSGLDNHLLYQVKRLLRQLCAAFSVPEPAELKKLDEGKMPLQQSMNNGGQSQSIAFGVFFPSMQSLHT